MVRLSWLIIVCLMAPFGRASAAPEPPASTAPSIYVGGFQRLCSDDPQIGEAVRQRLRRMGEQTQSVDAAGGTSGCCGLKACASPLRGHSGYLVGGMLGRQGNEDAAYVWVVDLAQGRVLIEHQRCSDCNRPERIASQAALAVERISAKDAPWVPLSSIRTCTSEDTAPTNETTARAVSARPDNNRTVITVRAAAGLRKSAGSVRSGLRSMLQEMGYQVREVTASPTLEDPRQALHGPLTQWPLVDISLQQDLKSGSQVDPDSVIIRHFHQQGARQTSLDCSMQDCSGESLVRLVRYNTGILLDQVATVPPGDDLAETGASRTCLPALTLDDPSTASPQPHAAAAVSPTPDSPTPDSPTPDSARPDLVAASSAADQTVPTAPAKRSTTTVRKGLTFAIAGLAAVSLGLFIWRATENNKFIGGSCLLSNGTGPPGVTVADSCTQKTWPSMLGTGLPALALTIAAIAIWPYAKKTASPAKVEPPPSAPPLLPAR